MKIKLYFAIISSLLTFSVSGQNFYTEVNFGYGYRSSSAVIDYNYSTEITTGSGSNTDISNYEVVKGSYGQGINFGLDAGYMITPNIGFELSCNYLSGSTITSNYVYSETSPTDYYVETAEYNYSARMLRLSPSVVFVLEGEQFRPFAKIGLVMGVSNKMTADIITGATDQSKAEYRLELDGGIPLGFKGQLGVEWIFTDRLSLTGSLSMYSLSYAPTNGKYTRYYVNGVDVLPSLSTSQREFEYVDEMTVDNNIVFSSGQPTKSLKFYNPFSSVGLQFGLRFRI